MNSVCDDFVSSIAGRFSEVRGAFRGGVVILASGPSARGFNVDSCALPIISVNGSISLFSAAKSRPLFYVCDDPHFVKQRPDLALEGVKVSENAALSSRCYEELFDRGFEIEVGVKYFLLEKINRVRGGRACSDRLFAWKVRSDEDLISGFSIFRKRPNVIGFSRDLSKGYYSARTIVYVAMQLAVHLGFDEIYLLGFDLSQGLVRAYDELNPVPSTLEQDYLGHILPSLEIMSRRAFNKFGFKVYNLSSMSRVSEDILPRAGFEAVLF